MNGVKPKSQLEKLKEQLAENMQGKDAASRIEQANQNAHKESTEQAKVFSQIIQENQIVDDHQEPKARNLSFQSDTVNLGTNNSQTTKVPGRASQTQIDQAKLMVDAEQITSKLDMKGNPIATDLVKEYLLASHDPLDSMAVTMLNLSSYSATRILSIQKVLVGIIPNAKVVNTTAEAMTAYNNYCNSVQGGKANSTAASPNIDNGTGNHAAYQLPDDLLTNPAKYNNDIPKPPATTGNPILDSNGKAVNLSALIKALTDPDIGGYKATTTPPTPESIRADLNQALYTMKKNLTTAADGIQPNATATVEEDFNKIMAANGILVKEDGTPDITSDGKVQKGSPSETNSISNIQNVYNQLTDVANNATNVDATISAQLQATLNNYTTQLSLLSSILKVWQEIASKITSMMG